MFVLLYQYTVYSVHCPSPRIIPNNVQVKDVLRVSTATPDPRFPKGVPDLKVQP